jgi:hypothetical protein
MPFRQTSNEGELFLDHRGSPGIPPQQARQMGYEPALVGEGKLFEAATLMCKHCQAVSIKNPLRTRERAFCMQCGGAYICDLCDGERRRPDYQHMPFQKIVDLVATGKATVQTLGVRPVLIPTKEKEI